MTVDINASFNTNKHGTNIVITSLKDYDKLPSTFKNRFPIETSFTGKKTAHTPRVQWDNFTGSNDPKLVDILISLRLRGGFKGKISKERYDAVMRGHTGSSTGMQPPAVAPSQLGVTHLLPYVNLLDRPPLTWLGRKRPYKPRGGAKRPYSSLAQDIGTEFEVQAIMDLVAIMPEDCGLSIKTKTSAPGYDAHWYNLNSLAVVHEFEITKGQMKNLPPNEWKEMERCVEVGYPPYTIITPEGPCLATREALNKWEPKTVEYRVVRMGAA